MRPAAACIAALIGGGSLGLLQGQSLTAPEMRRLIGFVGCIECGTSQRDGVRALAASKPIATVDTLNRILLRGMDSTHAAAYARHLGEVYDWGSMRTMSRDSFVAYYRRGYDISYRRHAAFALGWVRSARADSALLGALRQPLDSAVVRAVRRALQHPPL